MDMFTRVLNALKGVIMSRVYNLPRSALLVHEARRWVGVTEKGGDNKGPEVEMFQKAVDGKSQGEPWCMAFVQFCVQRVDTFLQSIGSSSKSNITRTEHCLTLWHSTPESMRCEPEPGAIIIWRHIKNGIRTASGHTGIVTEVLPNRAVRTIEGNTSDGAGIVREGNGVYERTRNLGLTGNMEYVGCVRPWPKETSK
jgi:hypothetical protein